MMNDVDLYQISITRQREETEQQDLLFGKVENINAFCFNDIWSSYFGVKYIDVERCVVPAPKHRYIETVNVSGAYYYPTKEYKERNHIIKINYDLRSPNPRQNTQDIWRWLYSKNYRKLIFQEEQDKYYLARIDFCTDLTTLDTEYPYGNAFITFICQPFKYGAAKTIFKQGPGIIDINNVGTREIYCGSPLGAKFNITIKGNWEYGLTIVLNGRMIKCIQDYSDEPNTLVLNTVNASYSINGKPIKQFLYSSKRTFLKLLPGNNKLYIYGLNEDGDVAITYIPMYI